MGGEGRVLVSPCNAHRRQVAGQPPWADLPPQLLVNITGRLAQLGRVAVRLVCSSWRARARSTPANLPFEAPRLLFRRPGPSGGLAFFSLHRREVLPFALPSRLSAGRCCGHIGGWLAIAFDDDRAIALCNLFSGESVAVPRAPVFPVAKIVLSAPPTSPGWVAAVLGRSGTVGLLQPDVSGGAWVTINAGAEHGGFQDMAFWRGRLCALGDDGAVLAYRANFKARVAAVSKLREKQQQVGWRRRRLYLVECEGELLVVNRQYSVWGDAVEVRRYRPEEREWEEVAELPGGRAVFVGTLASGSVPVGSGVRGNCVFYARRHVERMVPRAIGVYSLEDRETTAVAIAGGHSTDVEPVWIVPCISGSLPISLTNVSM